MILCNQKLQQSPTLAYNVSRMEKFMLFVLISASVYAQTNNKKLNKRALKSRFIDYELLKGVIDIEIIERSKKDAKSVI